MLLEKHRIDDDGPSEIGKFGERNGTDRIRPCPAGVGCTTVRGELSDLYQLTIKQVNSLNAFLIILCTLVTKTTDISLSKSQYRGKIKKRTQASNRT